MDPFANVVFHYPFGVKMEWIPGYVYARKYILVYIQAYLFSFFFLSVTDILTFVNSFSPSVYGVIEGKYFYNLLATDLLINLCNFFFPFDSGFVLSQEFF